MPQPEIDDLWADAKMEEVIEYLARASSLRVPKGWEGYFPQFQPRAEG